jgi:NAD(P)H-hydrate epimerase
MGIPKRGLFLYPGADFSGDVVVADIGFPRALVESDEIKANVLTEVDASMPIVRRSRDTHKGTYGHVLVIAGSLGKTGAAILCCNAAMRTGAGLVTLATDLEAQKIVEAKAVETMCATLADSEDTPVTERVFARLAQLCEGKRVLAIGPGIPPNPGMALIVRRVAAEITLPVVIDADGLNLLADKVEALRGAKGPRVLTPHPGEMAKLTGRTAADIVRDRIGITQKFASDYNAHVVLKGARSVIAAPDGRVWVNPTGNPGMATGGSGDVLCGILSSLIAQGIEAGQAARTAVYLHGVAGDRAAARIGEWGLIASDVLDEVPRVLKDWELLG